MPKWYRLTWIDRESNSAICYPVGVHVVAKFAHRIREWFAMHNDSVLDHLLMVSYQRGLSCGIVKEEMYKTAIDVCNKRCAELAAHSIETMNALVSVNAFNSQLLDHFKCDTSPLPDGLKTIRQQRETIAKLSKDVETLHAENKRLAEENKVLVQQQVIVVSTPEMPEQLETEGNRSED